MRRFALWIVAGCVLVATLSLAAFFAQLTRSHAGWSGEFVDVTLEPGLDAGSMLRRLHEAGVIRNPRLLRIWLHWSGESGALRAGEYRFREPASPLRVLERLREGEVLLHSVTIPEGLTLEQVARRLEEASFASAPELLTAFRDPTPIADLDPEATDLEGYLFPDTYHFPRPSSAERIARTMVQRFREVGDADYEAEANAVGLTLRQAVTLASLVEKETALPEERDRISRVFHNRLERGMLLQCDPTVIYALRRAGIEVKRLTHAHLEFASPWNTYRVPGLPPGPIANPGAASMDAAVHPAPGEELFFVAAPEGGHRFSKDLGSHRKAVREWRAYLRSSR
jgi:UPF0755 protein